MRINVSIEKVSKDNAGLKMDALVIMAKRKEISSQILDLERNDSDSLKNILKNLG